MNKNRIVLHEERAKSCGASKLYIENVIDEFCDDYIVPCVQANEEESAEKGRSIP